MKVIGLRELHLFMDENDEPRFKCEFIATRNNKDGVYKIEGPEHSRNAEINELGIKIVQELLKKMEEY